MDQNEKCLLSIRDEMENVYNYILKVILIKEPTKEETRTLFEMATSYGA